MLESVRRQTKQPDSVVCTTDVKYKQFPSSVRLKMQQMNVTLAAAPAGLRSYKKLVPLLQRLWDQDVLILVLDDDWIYRSVLFEQLLAAYGRFGGIVVDRGRQIALDQPYGQWTMGKSNATLPHSTLPLSGSGMLVPVRTAFTKLVLDMGLAASIAPTQDDIWWKVNAVLAGTTVTSINAATDHPSHREIRTHGATLWQENEKSNDAAWAALVAALSARSGVDVRRAVTKIVASPSPPWLVTDNFCSACNLHRLRHGEASAPRFAELVPVAGRPLDRSWDNEAYDAVHNFFWHRVGGTVVEMGALDGAAFSASRDFVPLGWQRILIEANPSYAKTAPLKSPDATFVNAAVCGKEQTVHYISSEPIHSGPSTIKSQIERTAVGGLYEFMSGRQLEAFHGIFYDKLQRRGSVDWSDEYIAARSQNVQCVPMRAIFASLGVARVHLFVLDTEGSELSVLESVDWDSVVFDVLCVETDESNREKGFAQTVADYLAARDYRFVAIRGRNSWFVRSGFTPSRSPSANMQQQSEFNVAGYWENRYSSNGNSGAGSYGCVAEFKVGQLCKLFADHAIQSMIDLGPGDGNVFSMLKKNGCLPRRYAGFDVSKTAVDRLRQKFPGHAFYHYDGAYSSIEDAGVGVADLSMSLDVIFHLVDDRVFEAYMDCLWRASARWIVVFSSNSDTMVDGANHVRHRRWTSWLERNHDGEFELMQVLPLVLPQFSFSDWYLIKKTKSTLY